MISSIKLHNKISIKQSRIFKELKCLEEHVYSSPASNLRQEWFPNADNRYLGQYLTSFLNYNKESFDFLDIKVEIEGFNKSAKLKFHTSSYIGAVPLRAPDTGKPMGDLIVIPRFSHRNSRIEPFMILLNEVIRPDFFGTIPLVSDYIVRPPMYMDASSYIGLFEKILHSGWHKFKSVEQNHPFITGDVNWDKYSQYISDPNHALIFPCSENVLSRIHLEFQGLRYIFDLASGLILSPEVPTNLKLQLRDRMQYIEQQIKDVNPYEVSSFIIHASDPLVVKLAKDQANLILKQKVRNHIGWRIDISILFERFSQHIIGLVTKELGGKSYINPKFASNGKMPSWGISYLEPDIVIKIDEISIPLDAKYKSNMFNLNDSSQILKETFRSDLHQLLAYASFSKEKIKAGIILYPSDSFIVKGFSYKSSINDSSINIRLVGLPFDVDEVQNTKQRLKEEILKLWRIYGID